MSTDKGKIKATLRWLVEIKYFWLFLFVVIGVVTIVPYVNPTTYKNTVIEGALLQILGSSTIIVVTHKILIYFQQPGLIEKSMAWIYRCPWLPGKTILKTASFSCTGTSSVKAYGHGAHIVRENASDKERIDSIEKYIKSHNEYVDARLKEIQLDIKAIAKEQAHDKTTQTTHYYAIQKTIKETNIGNFQIPVLGAGWLILGIILSAS